MTSFRHPVLVDNMRVGGLMGNNLASHNSESSVSLHCTHRPCDVGLERLLYGTCCVSSRRRVRRSEKACGLAVWEPNKILGLGKPAARHDRVSGRLRCEARQHDVGRATLMLKGFAILSGDLNCPRKERGEALHQRALSISQAPSRILLWERCVR